jgi:hypothetical protein
VNSSGEGRGAAGQQGRDGGDRGEIIQLRAVVRLDALAHGDAVAELDDGSSVVVSRTHRDGFLIRWRGR